MQAAGWLMLQVALSGYDYDYERILKCFVYL